MVGSFSTRARQTWTIARIELRRVFFARRGLWVYGLALLPAVIFFGHGVDVKLRHDRLARRGITDAVVMDSVRQGEAVETIEKRLGKPAQEFSWTDSRRVRERTVETGTTVHVIEPAAQARFVRLNITRPSYSGMGVARIYEFEVYGPAGAPTNLARGRTVKSSSPCRDDRGPEKAVNGSVTGGEADSWCSEQRPLFLQVDLGAPQAVQRFVVKHGSTGGETADNDTREFNIQVSTDDKTFTTVQTSTGSFVEQRTEHRSLTYFDGRRQSDLEFVDGKLDSWDTHPLLNFEEDRAIFAGIFQFFYLRIAIFFGCLGMFMYLFRGEMANRTLHYWLVAPARREVLLAGKYTAGLIASVVIFSGGALLAFAAMVWPHDAVELQAYWSAGGMTHAFWYAAAAALGCVGYGSVFLAVGLFVRNPIVPAAVLLVWESAHGVLPQALQRISILYYLQSLCPVPPPIDGDVPMLVRLLAAPVSPASRPGAILGLAVLTAMVLWIAAHAVRRMEISYGGEP